MNRSLFLKQNYIRFNELRKYSKIQIEIEDKNIFENLKEEKEEQKGFIEWIQNVKTELANSTGPFWTKTVIYEILME
jgi:hypothetical protein